MNKDCERERLLTIMVTKEYTQEEPEQLVELYMDLKVYLGANDSSLSEANQFSLMEMLFYLSVFMSKDVEAQVLFNTLRDRFGNNSPKLQVMHATLLQINENDTAAITYLENLLKKELEYSSDTTSYVMIMKKLISIKMVHDNSKNKTVTLKQLVELTEKFPLEPELWWMLGEIYMNLKDFDRAIYCFEEILCIMPFNYVAFAQLAESLYYKAKSMSHSSKAKVELRKEIVQKSMNNALRSIELSGLYLKGWSMVAITSQELGPKHVKIALLAKRKLQEISTVSNAKDQITAKYLLEKVYA